ncbi:MAG: hypothetical protein KGJ89_00835 [Patescibacteria group bacterium]|nr:hypothetical protein [Patescibacteria group bacterium]MDE2015059.1 hypothetical protein [Patescibacteria group bacterium]MDE2226487.1 hypothetical protein [Patescibacteria group bacterium]
MNNIKVGKYIVGTIIAIYILGNVLGDIVALGMIGSWLMRTIFLILFFIPISIVYKGYIFALKEAQKQNTKWKAWRTFLVYTIIFVVISYVVGYFLGYVAGLFA